MPAIDDRITASIVRADYGPEQGGKDRPESVDGKRCAAEALERYQSPLTTMSSSRAKSEGVERKHIIASM